MRNLVLILGDQLSRRIAALDGFDPATDRVLMLEVAEETSYVAHHPQKIALILSAMRHFAAALRDEGIAVEYVTLDDPANTGSFTEEVARAAARLRPMLLIVTEAGEYRVEQAIAGWQARLGLAVECRADTRFFASRADFAAWAAGRRGLRMEFFYRMMRRRTGLLMEGETPVGGQWNFDAENRKRLPAAQRPPPRRQVPPDAITRAVLALVGRRFAGHFGDLEPFAWAVTRDQALAALDHFLTDCLADFGDYQDAMRSDAPFLYHAVLSPYLNLGLLEAREVCARAEAAWRAGKAKLNAVEGFIRQILGWREYVRGIYWLHMPGYAATNALAATRPLPGFYWSGDTAMRCVAEVVRTTRRHAYAHHIQRLMVTGNFALLAGIAPAEIAAWYLAVYADAFEWVELPNVQGMALFADGGVMASKPYAASGAYIARMSDYCAGCAYDPARRTGPGACPFNLLYWDFLMRHQQVLGANPRLALAYRTLARMTLDHRATIRREAGAFLAGMNEPPAGQPRLL
ncbi:MAG: cryptochrome/photolyase family protein [Rhodospirillales bacterium]|nr:cryptochrome/photolyase family protein [Rhodospirillales bacterium]